MFGPGDSATFAVASGMFTLDFSPLKHDRRTISLISHKLVSQSYV